MNHKIFTAPLNFKADGDQGEFEAVFATLNVIDHDRDVTLPGAFGEQNVVIEPWNHNWSTPPVGKGAISEQGDEAIVKGRFFLQTEAGREHYEVAKELDGDQEFSYTFEIAEAEYGVFQEQEVRFLKRLNVIGVGQVTRGAGIDTRLTAIKNRNSSASTEADDSDSEGEAKSGKPSADADLMAAIQAAEISMIYHGIEVNNAEEK